MKPENIAPNLYVGNDETYEALKDRPGWAFVRCCKYGPGGHQDTLQYHSLGAPKGPDYLTVTRGNRMALNFIDAEDPNFIPREMVDKGLHFIADKLAEGCKVLVACNAGHSRGPTTAMLFLRSIGELPGNFIASERKFTTLYPRYDPGLGVRQFARSEWSSLAEMEL
jgi:hypothetical protein